jgi:hypothetical protein
MRTVKRISVKLNQEAFESEVKYWAAIAADIHPRIGSRQWTDEQKHYAYWLLV